MGITNKEETLDWLYRLKSEIYVYMPKEWLIPMNNALDVAIDTVKREKMLEDWTKKCRKFEADYENRLKADLEAILTELSMRIGEIEGGYVEFDEENKRSLTMIPLESVDRLIEQQIDKLKTRRNKK